MTHEEARELLLDLSYGELDPALRRQVETHVSGCTDCEAELEALASTRAAARLLREPGPPRGREELVEAARRAAASRSLAGRRSWARPAAWMATAALVLVVGGVTMRLLDRGPRPGGDPGPVVASAPAGRTEKAEAAPASPPPRPEAPPAQPSAPPPGALASRETADSPDRAAKRSRQDAPAPAAEASGAGPAAMAGARPREAKGSADFPPGTSGSFVSLDLRSGEHFRVNAAGCATRRSPYSTFKIPSSLIGLETGVVTDPDERWRWDATRYPPPSPAPGGDYLRAWQQDQSLRTALPLSIVWYFREVASRVGEPRMMQWLATFGYGNQDISGGIDRFWLGSSLRISPDEQAEFLARLRRGQFPVSRRNLDLLRELLTQETGPGFRLVAKTGSSPDGEGWLVGWVETQGGGCTFALHLEAPSYEQMVGIRPGLARDLLRRAGCMPR
jgi:beta-lactamase class D